MENLSERNTYAPKPEPPVEYTPAARYLLLVSLLLGAAFAFALVPKVTESSNIYEFMPAYALFFLIYAVGFYALLWKRVKRNAAGWYIIAAAALLTARSIFYHAQELSLVNALFAVPTLVMLHSLVTLRPVAPGLEGQYFAEYFKGWFYRPFAAIGRFFGAAGSLFKKGENEKRRAALLGILIALPVAGIVAALLISSDGVMSYFFHKTFTDISAGRVIWRTVLFIAVALLFYSFIYSSANNAKPVRTEPLPRRLPAVSMKIVLALLLVIYAVFAYFQFAYLTGARGLPEELTYSEYAVSGFSELLLVAAINLAVFGAAVSFTKEARGIRALLVSLLLCTLVVLYSAIMRLSLYIDAYGLTVNRILPMWFMLFLLFCVVLCCIRLFKPGLHLIRLFASVLIAWYLALNLLNVDAVVAKSVIARSDERGSMTYDDEYYLRHELSDDAHRVIAASGYAYLLETDGE